MYFSTDHYRTDQPGDQFRTKVAHLQDETETTLRRTCAAVGLPLTDIPTGLNTASKVSWLVEQIDPLLGSHRR